MKKLVIILTISFFAFKGFSQSGEIKPNQGISVPQFTTAFINLMLTQPKGTVVFDKDLNVMKYWDGTGWQSMSGGSGIGWQASGNDILNTNSGNVGVGTSSPSGKVEITTSVADALRVNQNGNNAGVRILASGSGSPLAVDNIGSAYTAIFSVGTSSGKGILSSLVTSGNPNDAIWGKTDGSGYAGKFTSETGTAGYFSSNSGNALVTGTGNVGIGTGLPITKLQVEGSSMIANNTTIDPDDNANKVVAGNIEDGSGWASLGIGSKTANAGQTWAIGGVNGDLSIAAGDGLNNNSLQTGIILNAQRNLLLTPFSGNVGLGVNASKAKLEVTSAYTTTAIFGSTSTGISLQQNWPTVGYNQYRDDANVQRYIGNGFALGNFINPTTGYMAWNAIPSGTAGNPTLSESTVMVLSPSGNLALGLNTPAVGTITTRRGNNFDGSAVFAGTTHNSHFHYGSNEDTYIRGGKNGSNVIINDGALGKVGIGIYPTTYKLEVNGTARTKEVIVETVWADYVFDEGYQLKSIDEMESFIKENKHLPNIPKASEIEKNGLKVGETNKAMMEKIEELALYIIQLKKEIDILKAKNHEK